MATTTPNFGWPVPTSTDLVKDGATAIEALGDSIDASLLDLKGGTSGQVLAKNSNTDMDFVWVTDAAGDITGVTAGTGISGGGTSGTVTVTNSMATAIDAKGDLVAGTGADTFARLAVGTNNQILVADSAEATGLKWATPAAAASGLTFIQRSTFSNVANTGTTFDGVFTSTYKSYFMIIEEMFAGTGSDDPQIQFRASAVTTTTTYDSAAYVLDNGGGTSTALNNGGAQISFSSGTGGSAYLSSGTFTITGVGNMADATITGLYYSGSTGQAAFMGGTRAGIQFDGFLLKSASSNISGTVAIYGLAAA